MGRISVRTGKVILSVILSLSSIPALAADPRFQKQNNGNSLDIDNLTIGTSDATAGGISNNAAVYLVTTGNYGDLQLSMSKSNANFNNNNIRKAVRVATNQANTSLNTKINNSSISLNSTVNNADITGIISEASGGSGQKHDVKLDKVNIAITNEGIGINASAQGIYAGSTITPDKIDISLNEVNIISKAISGNATGIGVGNSLKTSIVETGSGATIEAKTSGSLRTSYGIHVVTIDGENKISTLSKINSTSDAGGAYGIRVTGRGSIGQVAKNEVTHIGDINAIASSDAYGMHLSHATFENNITHNGNLNSNSSNGSAYGIYSTGNNTDTVSSGSINVSGNNSYGIYSSSTGNSTITTDATISASGTTGGTAIYSATTTGTNIVNVVGNNVNSIKGDTVGVRTISDSGEQIINNSGNISSANGQAILSTSNTGETTINNWDIINGAIAGINITSISGEQTINNSGTISSTNDQAILSTNNSGTTTINNNGVIKGYSSITGDSVEFNNRGTLELQNFATSAKGAINYTIGNPGMGTFTNSGTIKFSDANFDGANTHATFNVATFTNSGRIDLTGKNPTGATTDAGDIFTINGNYISNGGSLFLNTVLDDGSDSGASDLLQINGNVTTGGGATSVYITPTSNSLGQLTTGKGIKIIEVINGTSSADAFVLGKPLTSGAYEYVLGQDSSATNTADPNWYLTSFYNNNSNHILYNPAVASYLTNQTAAVEMFQQSLFDRLTSSSNGLEQGGHERLLWLRTTMNHGSRRSVQANMSNRGRSYTVQFGSDLALWEVNDGYLHLGVMGGYGDEENTSTSRKTRTKTDGKVKGYSAGLYGTWFQQQETYLGLYVDLWSQMGWYRNEVSGASQVATKKYNSTVWTSSVEAGYGISLGKSAQRDWVITPQLQLVYNLYDADNQHDKNNLYVSDNNATGIVARTGIKLSGNSIDKRVVEPFMEVNWLHTTAKNELKFNGQTLKDGLPRNRVETNIGLRGNISDRWSIAAQVGGQWGQNHFNQYEGQFNINYRW